MRRIGIISFLMMMLAMLPAMVFAANQTGDTNKVTMTEVVVTASRQDEAVAKVPADITVITAQQIEASTAQNVPEVLRSLAGVHISDISGNQRNYTVDLRGFGESSQQNILLLVDGRRVNLPDLSGPDWNLIPLDRIARIEVVRGSRGSVMYGDNATAGVINIITKEGRGLEGQASIKYGSYGTYKGGANLSGAHGRVGYDISANYADSDGYRDNSASQSQDLGANLRLDPNDKLRLQLSGGYHYDDTRNPGALFASDFAAGAKRTDTKYPDDFDKTNDYYAKAGLELDMLSNDMFKLETSYRNRDKSVFGSSVAGWFAADTQSEIYIASPQLIFREDFQGVSNQVILGLDYTQNAQDYDSQSVFYGSPSQIVGTLEKQNIAYFIHDELGIGKNWSLSGGYRMDRANFTYDFGAKSKKTLDEEAFDVGINYALGPRSHLYGSFARGFRYPVLDEQFNYATSTVDMSLQAQHSKDVEIGATLEVVPGLLITMNLFRIKTKDEIFFNAMTYKNENMASDTIRQGGELSLAWKWRNLDMGTGYTYTDTQFDGGPFDGNEIPNVPRDKITANIGYQLSRGLRLGMEAIYVGERYLISDQANAFDKAKAYTVVNAKVRYDWHWLTMFVDLNNILNEEYSAYSGVAYNMSTGISEPGYYPSPEFNVLAGITARFGK